MCGNLKKKKEEEDGCMYIIFVCVYASYIKYVCVFMLMHMYGCVDVFSICMCRGYGKGKKVSYYMCLCEKR